MLLLHHIKELLVIYHFHTVVITIGIDPIFRVLIYLLQQFNAFGTNVRVLEIYDKFTNSIYSMAQKMRLVLFCLLLDECVYNCFCVCHCDFPYFCSR